jgi:hypothetical protein
MKAFHEEFMSTCFNRTAESQAFVKLAGSGMFSILGAIYKMPKLELQAHKKLTLVYVAQIRKLSAYLPQTIWSIAR